MKVVYCWILLLCGAQIGTIFTLGSGGEEQEMNTMSNSTFLQDEEPRTLLIEEPDYTKKRCCGMSINLYRHREEEKKCLKVVVKVALPLICLFTAVGVGVSIYSGHERTVCTADLSPYPICGSITTQGIDQNQAVAANILGNILRVGPKGTPNHLVYGSGYCQKKPARTVCTHFDPSHYKNISRDCDRLKGGKLIGVVAANNKTQDSFFVHNKDNDCMHAAKLVEDVLKNSSIPYCKIDPEAVGFTIQRSQPIFLTLFLIAANMSLSVVNDQRWAYPLSLNDIEGPIWGFDGTCKASWSSNVDPSARLHAAQTKETVYKQKVVNASKLLTRLNKHAYNHKFRKTKHR